MVGRPGNNGVALFPGLSTIQFRHMYIYKTVADFHLETYKREFGVLLMGLLISDALFDFLVMSV